MIIKVKVRANSSKEEIKELSDKELVINIKEEAKNNKANIRLINLLSKYFNVKTTDIRIKTGLTAKIKLVEIKR